MESYIDQAVSMAIGFAPKLALAIVLLIVGFAVIGGVVKLLKKIMKKRDLDETLRNFLGSFASVILKVALLVSVAGIVGIETASFIALLGAAGIAIGLALQGSLSNFAGGVLLMIFRPFKVGQYITAQGYSGTVEDIQIFHTYLQTPDNRVIILANGPLAGGSIMNYSVKPTRRVDFTFGIGYSDDIDKAKSLLKEIIDADERVMRDPEPFIAVGALGDSSVDFTVRVWCQAADYWAIHFDMYEKVKKAFDAQGVSIPFPQRDVHLYKEND